MMWVCVIRAQGATTPIPVDHRSIQWSNRWPQIQRVPPRTSLQATLPQSVHETSRSIGTLRSSTDLTHPIQKPPPPGPAEGDQGEGPASERKLLLHVEPIFIEPAVWRLLFERDDIEAKDPDLKLGFFINSNLLLLPWTIMRLSSPAGNGLSCAGLSLPWISNPTALAFSLTAVISGTISTLQAILIRYGLLMA